MKVTAIICEYNPFHNGHAYQIQKARELTDADFIVVVMSGNFVQRGEPAIVNKWARSEMALKGGADLVLELPLPFAISSAEYFASGAVQVLENTGVVDYLCFGSEHGEIAQLQEIAEIFANESLEFKAKLKESLDKGLSYPSARANTLPKVLREIANSPNNILAIEYLKALIRLNSKIEPVTIKRIGAGYLETDNSSEFSSATAIRKHIAEAAGFSTISKNVPSSTFEILTREFFNQRGPVYPSSIFENLRYKIRTMTLNELAQYNGISEGLESKIHKAFEVANSYEEAINLIISKRYPKTRILRILLSIYLGFTSKKAEAFYKKGPEYLRVLGMKESSRVLLKAMKTKKSKKILLAMKLKPLVISKKKSVSNMAMFEALSTDLYVLSYPYESTNKNCGQEFLENPIILYFD